MKTKHSTDKYMILIDYHTQGMSFWDKGFDTVDEAVKEAQRNSYGNEFYIVKVIDWKAQEV